MRSILFLIPTLTGGGAERVVVTLLRHLDRSRFKATLGVVDLRGAAFREDVPADVELVDLGAKRVRYALPAIIRLVRQRRPDVVFSTLGHLNLALGIARPLFPAASRTVARESCVVSAALADSPHPRWWTFLYRRFYARHDLIVCQSGDMREDLVRNFGIPAARSVIIHNPVDMETIRSLAAAAVDHDAFSTGAPVLVAAGRLDPQKGFDLLIDALAQVPDSQLQLIILGEGPQEEALRALAKRKGVQQRVHFAGFQRNPYAWFAKADAFVLSSRFEGFPNVVLEALACGTPVIATPAPGGINELLGGRADCVVASAITAPALATAIATWLAGPRGRVPADAVAPYGLAGIVRRYEEILS